MALLFARVIPFLVVINSAIGDTVNGLLCATEKNLKTKTLPSRACHFLTCAAGTGAKGKGQKRLCC